MAATETTTNNGIKRRKTEQEVAACLSDLPIGILEHTASFLAPPSRALFAIALTNNENNNPPSENYSSIAGADDWSTLDFGEIEKDLATRLIDDDISDVLQHIDAVNKLKRLRLTNCTKITGVGLEPLRGSTIIELVDLSLTDDGESPMLDPDPPISSELVLPILDSIVAAERCSLKHLQFPHKFRTGRSTDSDFHAFIGRYNDMRDNRDTIICLHCDCNLPHDPLRWVETRDFLSYGLHNYTCFQCTNHYCIFQCDRLQYCQLCQRDYCKGCTNFDYCELCEDEACEYCSKLFSCNECNKTICKECIGRDEAYGCSYCDVVYCEGDCSSRNKMEFCEGCRKRCCNSCRLRLYQEGGSDCIDCSIKILPYEAALVDQSRRLQQEVEQLKNEVRGLKDVNKELQEESKELNDKIKLAE